MAALKTSFPGGPDLRGPCRQSPRTDGPRRDKHSPAYEQQTVPGFSQHLQCWHPTAPSWQLPFPSSSPRMAWESSGGRPPWALLHLRGRLRWIRLPETRPGPGCCRGQSQWMQTLSVSAFIIEESAQHLSQALPPAGTAGCRQGPAPCQGHSQMVTAMADPSLQRAGDPSLDPSPPPCPPTRPRPVTARGCPPALAGAVNLSLHPSPRQPTISVSEMLQGAQMRGGGGCKVGGRQGAQGSHAHAAGAARPDPHLLQR